MRYLAGVIVAAQIAACCSAAPAQDRKLFGVWEVKGHYDFIAKTTDPVGMTPDALQAGSVLAFGCQRDTKQAYFTVQDPSKNVPIPTPVAAKILVRADNEAPFEVNVVQRGSQDYILFGPGPDTDYQRFGRSLYDRNSLVVQDAVGKQHLFLVASAREMMTEVLNECGV